MKRLPELPGTEQTLPSDSLMGSLRDSYFFSSTRRLADGRPERIEIWAMGQLSERLTFHENGHLRSEEQFSGGRISSASYYDDSGKLLRRVETPGWISNRPTHPGSRPALGEPVTITSEELKLQVRVTTRFISTNASIDDPSEAGTAKPLASKRRARAVSLDESLRTWLQKEAGITLATPAGTDADLPTTGLTGEVAILSPSQTESVIRHFLAESHTTFLEAPGLTTWSGREAWLSSETAVALAFQKEPSENTHDGGRAGTSVSVTPTVSRDRTKVTLAVEAMAGGIDDEQQLLEAAARVSEIVTDKDTLLVRMPITRYRAIGAHRQTIQGKNRTRTDIVKEPAGGQPGSEGAVYMLLTPTIIVIGDIENERFPNLIRRGK